MPGVEKGGKMNFYILVIVVYLLGIILYSLYLQKKKVSSSDDFVRAGGSLPLPILIGTLLATWMGSGMVTGVANFIHTYGPVAGALQLVVEPIGLLIVALVLARRAKERTGYTIPELVARKFGDVAGVVLTICIVLAYVGIVAYQFKAAGIILNITTGLDQNVGILISLVLILILSITAGMFSVAYTDAIGTLVIIGSMLVGLPIAISQAGGLSGMIEAIPVEKMSATGQLNFVQLSGYILPIFFLVLGEQNIYQRFGSAKNVETAVRSGVGLFLLGLLLDILVIGIVTPSIVLFPNLESADAAFFMVAKSLPIAIGSLLFASAVALSVTTADSYLLSAATNITYDIYTKYINKKATDGQKLFMTRAAIIPLGLVAYLLIQFFPSILSMQMYAYSMYGAAVTPAFLACLFWDNATKAGGLASIFGGGATVLIWEIVLKNPMGLNSIVIAGPLSIVLLVVFSKLTAKTAVSES